jgi:transglutaminase-like putative cysteine protease
MFGLFWVIGYGGAWFILKQRQGWAMVLLGGTVVELSLLNLADRFQVHLLFFLAVGLFLLVQLNVVRRQGARTRGGIQFGVGMGLLQAGAALFLGMLVVLIVAVVPAAHAAPLSTLGKSAEGAFEWYEDQFGRLFAGLPSRRDYTSIVWGDSTHFGGALNLTQEVLFTVNGRAVPYWRARTYETYTGAGWTSNELVSVRAQKLEMEELDRRVDVRHQFRIIAATNALFSAGEPVGFNVRSAGLIRPGEPWDPLQILAMEGREFFPTRINLRYTATGNISNASTNQLQSAGTDYPDWVTGTYLQLPDEFPQRVRDLAIEISSSAGNPHDKAKAIEQHLKTYTYNLNIHAPPESADGVDFFLFTQQEGYCDYYASSMIVMLRAIGIPARYVLGYATGEWDSKDATATVRDLNYHSWVEAYFPGYGWRTFEPTSDSAIEFGGGTLPRDLPDLEFEPSNSFLNEDDDEGDLGKTVENFSAAGAPVDVWRIARWLATMLVLALVSSWYWFWFRLGRLGSAEGLYAKMVLLARAAGIGPQPHQTPYEYGAYLASQMPEHIRAINTVVAAYVNTAYHRRRIMLRRDLAGAAQEWNALRWPLLQLAVRARLRAFYQDTRTSPVEG